MEAAVQLGLDKTFDICMPCYGHINMSFLSKGDLVFLFLSHIFTQFSLYD
jgi:hypothetical protein